MYDTLQNVNVDKGILCRKIFHIRVFKVRLKCSTTLAFNSLFVVKKWMLFSLSISFENYDLEIQFLYQSVVFPGIDRDPKLTENC